MTRASCVRAASAALLFLGASISGCGNDAPAPAPVVAPAIPRGPYRVVPVANAGSIVGACRLLGHPEPAKLRAWPGMGADGPRDDGSVAVGEQRALGGCVVTLAALTEGKDWPLAMRDEDRSITLTIIDGRYEPRCSVVRQSTQLEIVSRIAADLNIHGFLLSAKPETVFNFSVEPGSKKSSIADAFLTRSGVVRVSEDARAHFTAWIHVVANPYFAMTRAEAAAGGDAGAYRLDEVPAGDYDLVCWHEPMDRREYLQGERFAGYQLGPAIELRRRVHVSAGTTTTIDFDVEQPAR